MGSSQLTLDHNTGGLLCGQLSNQRRKKSQSHASRWVDVNSKISLHKSDGSISRICPGHARDHVPKTRTATLLDNTRDSGAAAGREAAGSRTQCPHWFFSAMLLFSWRIQPVVLPLHCWIATSSRSRQQNVHRHCSHDGFQQAPPQHAQQPSPWATSGLWVLSWVCCCPLPALLQRARGVTTPLECMQGANISDFHPPDMMAYYEGRLHQVIVTHETRLGLNNLIAPAQSVLLEAYRGGALAAAAQTLADNVRAAFEPLRDREDRRRRRQTRSRRHWRARQPNGDANPTDADPETVPTCPPPATATSDAAWEALDDVDLSEELRHPVPTLQDVPPFMRAAVRSALTTALTRLRAAHAAGQGTAPTASRAWKLFLLAPRMLLTRSEQQGRSGHTPCGRRRLNAASGSNSLPPRGLADELPSRSRNSTQMSSPSASANGRSPGWPWRVSRPCAIPTEGCAA